MGNFFCIDNFRAFLFVKMKIIFSWFGVGLKKNTHLMPCESKCRVK